MSADTKIEWTHMPGFLPKSWNPVRGCSRISRGCENCYAERMAARFSDLGQPFYGYAAREKPCPDCAGVGQRYAPVNCSTCLGTGEVPAGARWTGRVDLIPAALDAPLRWRKPCCVFVNSMSDLFHESLSDEAIAAVFGVMAAAPQHRFLVLTKRAERMRRWFEWVGLSVEEFFDKTGHFTGAIHSQGFTPFSIGQRCQWLANRCGDSRHWKAAGSQPWPIPNVWLGVSVENQATADERIPQLLATHAAVRFVSYEPALAGIDFDAFLRCPACGYTRADAGFQMDHNLCSTKQPVRSIDWLIVGGESGPGARPFDVAWARSAIEQCRQAGVPVFVKQLGARPGAPLSAERMAQAPDCDCYDSGCRGGHGDWCQFSDRPLRLHNRKGADPAEWPEDLRVREWPHP